MTLNFQLTQRFYMAASASLAGLTGLLLFFSIWQWYQDFALTQATIAPPQIVKHDRVNDLIASIPDNHLFGKSLNQLPITNLQMRVSGIVKTLTHSKAYISIEGQAGKIYQVGDRLPHGVKIYSISNDAVILENEGHFEKLPLPREKLVFKPRNSGSMFS